uniref:Uncharacterized protein n=1 Tax=Arundo donax TaxID=35708 RepID=A0A0A9FNZ8_ARUDO
MTSDPGLGFDLCFGVGQMKGFFYLQSEIRSYGESNSESEGATKAIQPSQLKAVREVTSTFSSPSPPELTVRSSSSRAESV